MPIKTTKLSPSKNTPLALYTKMELEDKKNKRIWKFFAAISIIGYIICCLTMIYAVRLPRSVPMVITVSDWGEAKYVGEVNKLNYSGIKVPPIAIEYQIRKFVTNKFSLSTDKKIVRDNLRDCFSCLTSSSATKLSSELKEKNPLNDVGNIVRTVEIESILAVSNNSYQVDFIVISQSFTGVIKNTVRLRGVITTKLLEPSDEDKILNPLGIYISNYDFTEIKIK